jgi:hypothetical protein
VYQAANVTPPLHEGGFGFLVRPTRAEDSLL